MFCPLLLSIQLILLLGLFQLPNISTASNFRLHLVSFNVGDNKKMPNYKLTDEIIEKLWQLPAESSANNQLVTDEAVYALTLQENCDRCNQGNVNQLAQQILQIIQKREKEQLKNKNAHEISLISLSMTRESKFCESLHCIRSGFLSKLSRHGTTLLMIFARKQFVLSPIIKTTKQVCTMNAEKGITAARFTVGKGDETHVLCIAGLHLDTSDNIHPRKNCLKDFFLNNLDWKETCSSMFIAGDFNTRTGTKKKNNNGNIPQPSPSELQEMKNKDEMNGRQSYSGENLLNSMMDFTQCAEPIGESISLSDNLHRMTPTYSVADCENKAEKEDSVCYTSKRPVSWTDRIICWKCEQVGFYGSLAHVNGKSDHLPVAGLFTLTLDSQPNTCKRQ